MRFCLESSGPLYDLSVMLDGEIAVDSMALVRSQPSKM